MHKMLLFLFLTSTLLYANDDYLKDRILFCLKKDLPALSVRYENGMAVTDYDNLNKLLQKYQVTHISRWLTSAKEHDVDGDVKLANIYRAEFTTPKTMPVLQNILDDFRRVSEVYDAQPETIERLSVQTNPYTPNDTRYSEQWYLTRIMANYAWGLWDTDTQTPGDSTIIIGIVDTGVDYDHPDIAKAMFWNLGEDINGDGRITEADINGIDDDGNGYIDDFRGWDFANNNNNVKPPQAGPNHDLSHGTHVGGIAGAVTNNETGIAGVSFSSKLLFTKHARDTDLTNPPLYNTTDGMLYCAQMGAKIINCSFGGTGYNAFVQNTINNIVNNYGAIIVCAAGNSNTDNDNTHHYPSDYNNTIGVAALTSSDTKANYSNYGEILDISAPGGQGSSPGTAILSAIHWDAGGYESWQGTSMASPVAAGSFALLWSWFPEESRSWIIDELLFHADPIDDLNPSHAGQLGSGRVNVYNAIARNTYPYLTVAGYTLNIVDDNGNGELNPGETASMQLTLNNDPFWLNANGVSVTLAAASPYLTFTDAQANYGTITAGASVANGSDELIFTLSPNATLEPIPVMVTIRANQNGEHPYQVTDSISIIPTLNQRGFPVLSGANIVLPVSCDSLFGTAEKHVIVLSDIGDDSLYVFDVNGNLLDGFPVMTGYTTAAPVVADMNGNGQKEIVVATRSGVIKVFSNEGELLLDHASGEQVHGNIAVANMDGDLNLEIVFGTMSRRLHVLKLNGTEVSGFPLTFGYQIQKGVALGDLTGNGVPEILFGLLTNNEFHIITAEGDSLPNFPITLGARINSAPVIAHLQSTSTSRSIFVATTNRDIEKIETNGTRTVIFNSESPINSNPALFDLNNDQSPEIIFGNDAGNLFALSMGGDVLSGFPVTLNGKISTSPVFADFDNDGSVELVISTDTGYLYVLNSDGSAYPNFPAAYPVALRGSACVDDLDNDGDLEVFVGSGNGLHVLDVSGNKGSGPFWSTYMANNARTGSYIFEVEPSALTGESLVGGPLQLLQNFPNPFNPQTTIQYTLSEPARVELAVFNILGQHVITLVRDHQDQGTYFATWDALDRTGQRVVSGVYFYKLIVENNQGKLHSYIKKMLLVR